MCGIWAVFGSNSDVATHCINAYKISHRGPDAFRLETIFNFSSCCLGFHRLAIMDAENGMQPMRVSLYPHLWLIYNGEIYNYKNLQKKFDFQYATRCDGESIIHLYARGGIAFAARHLDGVFAFCLLDTSSRKIFLGRDTFGVKPLFRILLADSSLSVSSEVKGLMDIVKNHSNGEIQHLLPGHVETYGLDIESRVSFESTEQFYRIGDEPVHTTSIKMYDDKLENIRIILKNAVKKRMMAERRIGCLLSDDKLENIRILLKNAVKKRMMAERRIGCLLSGGLDSSLVTALLVELAKEENLPYPIQTFSVGMEDGTDLAAARNVAKHLGTEHHELIFTPEEAIAAIENVIYHLESYDVITIRGSAAMYLLCKHVKEKTDTTVLLSGEGADEIAQGYIYFHDAPTVGEGDKDSRRLCNDINVFDVQRVDRISAAFGLEIRVPYLDHTFSSYYLSLAPELRAPTKGIEKHLLRSAFENTNLLPSKTLWRQKEGFSDGVTAQKKSLYGFIQDFVGGKIMDSELEECNRYYRHNVPFSKESLYYRRIFEKFYPGQCHMVPYFWMPKWSTSSDPTARTLKHYKQ